MNMRILIAGGAGFIGSNLSKSLVEDSHYVICIDDLSRGRIENIKPIMDRENFEFIKEDLLSCNLTELNKNPDIVVNLVASKIPRYTSAIKTLELNVDVNRKLLDYAKQAKARYILVSTSDVYGKSEEFPLKETGNSVLGPSFSRRWAYAVSKLYNEHLSIAYSDEYGIEVVILRYFGVYGPFMHLNWWGGPVGVFIKSIYNNELVEIHGDGRQKRSFVYISDVVRGTKMAMFSENVVSGDIFNIGTDEEISIIDLAHKIAVLLNAPELKLKFVPYENFTKNYEDVRRRVGSTEKSLKKLGFSSEVTIEEGLLKTIQWYREAKLKWN